MSHRTLLPLLSALLILLALVSGCGKANPVAPSGSMITLSANPAVLPSPTGTSTITAVVRKPNGTVAAGVDVRFTTTLGTIDVLKQTDSGGVATATLRGDGRAGTASVGAEVDGGANAMALMVPIGGGVKTITLAAIPANIPAAGGMATLIAIVRDATGQPAAGVEVTFTTNLGNLASKGNFRPTNGSGEARDTLIIAPSDVTNQTSVMVTATAAAPDGTLQTAMATVSLVNPNAAGSITVSADPGTISASKATNSIALTAVVLNTAGNPIDGANVLFSATLGHLDTSGIVTTKNGGIAMNTLTVTGATQGQSITVTAQVPGVGGTLISNTTTITVTQ